MTVVDKDPLGEAVTVEPVKKFRPVAINVGVNDLPRAIAFYEALFEAPLEVEQSGGRPTHARAQFGDDDRTFFLLNLREREADAPHRDHVSAFGFNVEDLDGAHARAVAAGATGLFGPVEQPGLPRHAGFKDPSGNRVVLWQQS